MSEKILFVDDNADTQVLVRKVLEREGYQVLGALNGEEALALAREEQPGLILMDLMMPGMDGLEVIRCLRRIPDTAHIPVIIFTVKTDLKTKSEGFEAGADDYLTKLTSPAEVAMRIKATLRKTAVRHGRLVGVLATRGGLGVTTVAFNLCVTLHRLTNEKVIAADFRPGQGAFRVLAGERDAGGLSRLMQQDSAELSVRQVERELIQHSSGFRLLLASDDPADAGQIASVGHFEAITRHLAGLANYVVLDLGPALPPTTTQVLEQLDQIILVVEPVPQTVAQSKLMLEGLRRYGVGHSKVSVVAVNRGGTSLQLTLSQMEDQLGCSVLVVFPPAAELAYRAAKDGQPMVSLQPDSLIAEHFAKPAASISR